MKTKFASIFTGMIILMTLATSGCKEKEIAPPEVKLEDNKVKIEQLKSFYADLINTKKENIIYDTKTEMFSVSANDKISKDKLTRIYNNLNSHN